MKLYSKLSALGAVVALSTAFASATTINIDSNATTAGGSTVYASTTASGVIGTVGIDYNLTGVTPTWGAAGAGSSWVGITPTAGPTGTVNPAQGTYTFTQALGSGLVGYSGSIDVLADDTTSVYLNGTLLVPADGGGDTHCETGPLISCLVAYNVGLPGGAAFSAGANTLTFVVLQAGSGPLHGGGTGDPSGLDYYGSITNATPEPSTLLLLGTGLVGSAGALFRRMRSAVK
jgi:PEP-CTERM motif